MSITATALLQCTMRETIHLNGGKEFFGYVLVCNQHPRLQRVDKCWRKTKTTTIEYRVDGKPVASLDEAADRLNIPPVVSAEMKAELAKVTPEFQDVRRVVDYEVLAQLADCGLIEWRDGKCRLAAVDQELAR